MNSPLVSVQMITYNHAPYISQAIEGVLSQKTNFPFELVIGEDCSTDGTREIVAKYQKKYPGIVRVITSDENVGSKRNSARTRKACTGKYVAYCEGDDHWHCPEKLQIQCSYMESNVECGLVHSDYNRYIVNDNFLIKDFNKYSNNIPADNLNMISILRGGSFLYILTCTVMARKYMVDEIVEADPELYQSPKYLAGDTCLWAEIAYRSKTYYINKSLATYNVLLNSASKSTSSIKHLIFGKSVSEIALYLIKKYNLPESETVYHLKNWCNSALPLAFYTRDRALALYSGKYIQVFSIKCYIFYVGSRNSLAYAILIKAIKLRNILKEISIGMIYMLKKTKKMAHRGALRS